MNTSSPTGKSPGKEAAEKAQHKAGADVSAAADKVKSDARSVRDEVENEAKSLAHEVEAEAGNMLDSARGFADEQKNLAARQVGGVADAVSRAAGELDGDQAAIAGQLRQAAAGLNHFADDVRDRSIDELVGMAEDFGRRQPAAFIGAAAIAGFAASRFLSATAERRRGGTTANADWQPNRRVSEAEAPFVSDTRTTETH